MIPNPRRRTGLNLFAVALLCCPFGAQAQDFPNRAIHIIVPYTSGTGTDIVARLMMGPLSERLKQAIIIDNKPGAGAALGVKALKDARPDGYTVGVLVSGNAIQPWITKDLGFDIRKDFAPITLMYSGPLVMTVPTTSAVKTVAEFVASAKANPDKVFFGSAGAGTTSHLVPEMLKQVSGAPMTHVPFKGSPEVYTAMFGGSVQTFFDNYATPKSLVEAGKLRVLGISSAQRVSWLPNVPTFAETYPGFEASFWTGFAAPLGTPKAVLDRLTTELRAVLQMPEIRARMAELGLVPGGNTPAEFSRYLASEYDKWGKVTQAAGMKPE